MKKMYALVMISAFLSMSFVTQAQDLEAYEKKVFESKENGLPYRLLMPKNYNPNISYPLLMFLHGAGERGSDNELQLVHGARFFLKDSIRDSFPAIVVFPQCKTEQSWSNVLYAPQGDGRIFLFPENVDENLHQDLLSGLVKELRLNYLIDDTRIYVGGLSMGGMGTFEFVRRNPKMVAAAFAICGAYNPKAAGKMNNTAWWIFHGEDDTVVPTVHSQDMYDALKASKADVKLTLYPGVQHDSWTNTFAEPGLMEWLFSHRKN